MPTSLVNPRLLQSEPIQRCDWPNCGAACCVYGTWVDSATIEDILAHTRLIQPHLPAESRDPQSWFGKETEEERHALSGKVYHTRVVDSPDHYGGSACIFLREDHKCALQLAGEQALDSPWRFKPFYCILHPLELDDQGRITLDETHLLVDEPASCLRSSEHRTPLLHLFKEELLHFLGESKYQSLLENIQEQD